MIGSEPEICRSSVMPTLSIVRSICSSSCCPLPEAAHPGLIELPPALAERRRRAAEDRPVARRRRGRCAARSDEAGTTVRLVEPSTCSVPCSRRASRKSKVSFSASQSSRAAGSDPSLHGESSGCDNAGHAVDRRPLAVRVMPAASDPGLTPVCTPDAPQARTAPDEDSIGTHECGSVGRHRRPACAPSGICLGIA